MERAEKDTVVEGKQCLLIVSYPLDENSMVVAPGKQPDESHFIAVEGDEVWCLSEEKAGEKKWVLIYDFALPTGRDALVSFQGIPNHDIIARCEETATIRGTGKHEPPIMRIREIAPEYPEDYSYNITQWLPGIGSEWGLIFNSLGYFVGNPGNKLLAVKHKGEFIYYDDAALGVDDTTSVAVDSPGNSTATYTLSGAKAAHPEKGRIYISEGKKYIGR